MELRVLRYFLAVAREETISGAAEALHVTQPTLSRQMMELEEEVGTTLFLRGKRRITLTEEGMFLRKRAQEIVSLVEKTEAEFKTADSPVSGDVYIGGGETEAMRLIARAAHRLQAAHPHIAYHLFSGNAEDVTERLDRGLVDFGVFVGQTDLSKYDFIRLPVADTWGVLMRKDSPLAAHAAIRPEDLLGLPVLHSHQALRENELAGWMRGLYDKLHIVSTYNLIYNASLMVEEGLGYALTISGLIRTSGDSPLCFRPLEPPVAVGIHMVWKKYQIFSKAAEAFLEHMRKEIAGSAGENNPRP